MEQHTQAAPVTVQGMDDHGWSNSPSVPSEPANVHPEVTLPAEWEPGQSNSAAVAAPPAPPVPATTDENGDALPPTGQLEPGHSNTEGDAGAEPAAETKASARRSKTQEG